MLLRNERKSEFMTSTIERKKIESKNGYIPLIIQKPFKAKRRKCPAAILMHGIMADKEYPLLKIIADSLVDLGFMAVRFDFNGHGEGYGTFQQSTVPKEVDDAKKVISYIHNLHEVSEIYLIGHSQGGAVASLAAGELNSAIKGLVLLAPAAILVDDAINGAMMGVKFDPVTPPEYVEVFNYRVGKEYIRTAQSLDIYGKSSLYKGSVCIIHGSKDMVIPSTYSKKYHDIYSDCELHIINGENHSFEKNTNRTLSIITEFLRDKCKLPE